MILDRTHIKWAAATGAVAVVTGLQYEHYARTAVNGPTGGSIVGLCYGIAGFLIIAFACSLSLRRRVPHWRLGHAQTWLKAHIWLSLLCVPFALYHAAFHMRGVVASAVLILFFIVIASGIFGLFLQQFIPKRMLGLSRETVFDEIDSVAEQLGAEAFRRVKIACMPRGWNGDIPDLLAALQSSASKYSKDSAGGPFLLGTAPLVDFYATVLQPYLAGQSTNLASVAARSRYFVQMKTVVPKELSETIDDLESICRERSELDQQRTLHRWLHSWLYVHAPISMLLLVMLCFHAVLALQYIPIRFPGT